MPVVIGRTDEAQEQAQEQDVQALLVDEEGKPTLEAEICQDFLDDVDFDSIFDDPEVRDAGLIKTEEVWFVEKDGELVDAKEGDEGAEVYTVETLDAETLVGVLDDEDLLAMFEYFVQNELADDTLEDKARLAAAQQLVGITEKGPFKKGDFRKMRKGSPDQVMRMLLAMLGKEAIQRTAKGKGYKAGDYKKHPAGYGGGTPSGVKKWRKYRKQKAAQIKKAAKKTLAQKKRIAAKKGTKKAAAKKGAAAGLAKKGAGKGKRGVAAAEEPKGKQLSEGAKLSGQVLGKMHGSSLVEEEKEKPDKKE